MLTKNWKDSGSICRIVCLLLDHVTVTPLQTQSYFFQLEFCNKVAGKNQHEPTWIIVRQKQQQWKPCSVPTTRCRRQLMARLSSNALHCLQFLLPQHYASANSAGSEKSCDGVLLCGSDIAWLERPCQRNALPVRCPYPGQWVWCLLYQHFYIQKQAQ